MDKGEQSPPGIAVVWGARGGIGRALVGKLVAHGVKVIACGRSLAGDFDANVKEVEVDLANDYAVRQAVMEIAQIESQVDALIYCAGDIVMAKTADMQVAQWHQTINANLTGAYLTTHHALPLLKAQGQLVFVGARSERLHLPGMGAYAAAKAGLEAFAAALAKEERHRVVTLLRPGAVDTPFWSKVSMRLPKSALSADDLANRIWQILRNREPGTIDL
jgi:3-oxoacyl-[acyl-carrier protein] reductase